MNGSVVKLLESVMRDNRWVLSAGGHVVLYSSGVYTKSSWCRPNLTHTYTFDTIYNSSCVSSTSNPQSWQMELCDRSPAWLLNVAGSDVHSRMIITAEWLAEIVCIRHWPCVYIYGAETWAAKCVGERRKRE